MHEALMVSIRVHTQGENPILPHYIETESNVCLRMDRNSLCFQGGTLCLICLHLPPEGSGCEHVALPLVYEVLRMESIA